MGATVYLQLTSFLTTDCLLSLPRVIFATMSFLMMPMLHFWTNTRTWQALVRSSPELASQPEFQALSNLRGVDVVAVRLFFKGRLDMPRAASVAGGGMAPGKKTSHRQACNPSTCSLTTLLLHSTIDRLTGRCNESFLTCFPARFG